MERNDSVGECLLESVALESILEKSSCHTQDEVLDRMWEQELPDSIKDLMRRLEASSCTGGGVTDCSWMQGYSAFFRKEYGESPQHTEARLKVLEALGCCQTLLKFNPYFERVQEWNWSMHEWTALLEPLQTISVQLEKISMCSLFSPEEDQINPLWNKLLRKADNLKTLYLYNRITPKLTVEVTSGMRANSRQKLKSLELDLMGSDGEVGVYLAEIISCAPYLEVLTLGYGFPLDAVAREALSGSFKSCRHLQNIQIHKFDSGMWTAMWEVLADAYTDSSVNPVLERLEVKGPYKDPSFVKFRNVMDAVGVRTAAALCRLIRGNVKEIILDSSSSQELASTVLEHDSQCEGLGQSLLHAPFLQTFRMDFNGVENELLEKICTFLEELSKASNNSPLLYISSLVEISSRSGLQSLRLVQTALNDTYLKRLQVSFRGEGVNQFNSFVDTLVSNTSIQSLGIDVENPCEETWSYLFNGLRKNSCIRKLLIRSSSKIYDVNFRDLIDLLQVNFTLQEIDVSGTSWGKDGHRALIDEALSRNKTQADYFSVLRGQNLAFEGAKTGRVFLCGSPLAVEIDYDGDHVQEKHIRILFLVTDTEVDQKFKLRRTKGIEVELLCDNEAETVSIWDLAGQDIFRALQNLLFPRISQACVFCFVFNPFQGEDKNREIRKTLLDDFYVQLKSWLKFVASVQIRGRMLPQMIVIVTHGDKLKKCQKEYLLKSIEDYAKDLQERYKGVVDLCPAGNTADAGLVYQLNAKAKSEVQTIKDLILSRMKNVLETKSPMVPTACSQLASLILQRRGKIEHSPVLLCEDFYRFCSTQISALNTFDSKEETGRSVLHAVARYLHDVGAIFMTRNAREGCGVIVVDLNWLTQNLLGELASDGHGFQTESGRLSAWQSDSSRMDDGFIDPTTLHEVIQRILENKKGVDIAVVKELLFELDLCYSIKPKNGPEKYFMPMILGTKDGRVQSQLSWVLQHSSSGQKETSSGPELHFGFRIQCVDKEKTSFTHGFFPRSQIYLRKYMNTTMDVDEENFVFSRHHVKIINNGCIVFVEIDTSGENHVDVMVQFSKDKTRDWAMNYVQENVVEKLIKFAASEDGCPAVQLTVAVLRTQCVEQLTPRTFRGESQAVPIETLKRRVKAEIERQLQKGDKDDKTLFGYMHAWPEITSNDVRLPGMSELARKLLSSKDFDEVVADVEKTHHDLWQNLHEIEEVSRRLGDLQNTLLMPDGRSVSTSSLQESLPQRKQESESLIPEASLSNMTNVAEYLVKLGEKVDQLGVEMRTSFDQVRIDLKTFKSTRDEMLSKMSRVESTVNTIIGYTISKDIHRTPNRPYFKSDVSLKEKVTAALLFGVPVRLHFMCEARGKVHLVDGQEGLELRFEKEDKVSRSMRTLSVVSMKLIWVLLKIGAQFTAGLGSAIPDFSCLVGARVGAAATNIALDRMSVEIKLEKNLSWLEPAKVEEAWCCLKDHLADKLTTDTYANLFKLHLVRYRESEDPYAWLCPSCVSDARRNFLLEQSRFSYK